MDLASILLVALPLVLLPAILMRGRKSAPLWTALSAIGAISLLAASGIGSQASGIALDGFALAAGMLLFYIAVPIGVVGLVILVDRMVVRALQWLRRSRRPGGVWDGGMAAAGDRESPGPVEARSSGRSDLAIRIAVGVVLVGLIVATLFGDSIERAAREASSGFVRGNIAKRVDGVTTPGVPIAELESELTFAMKSADPESLSFLGRASQRWHPVVALMYLQDEVNYRGPWVGLLQSSDAEVLSAARSAVQRRLVEKGYSVRGYIEDGWAVRVAGPTPESDEAAEAATDQFLGRGLEGRGFRLNSSPVGPGGRPRVIPQLDGYEFQRIEYELTSDEIPNVQSVRVVHLASPDGHQWYVVGVEME